MSADLPGLIEQCLTNGPTPGDYRAQRDTVLTVLRKAKDPQEAAQLLDMLGLRPAAVALRVELDRRSAA